MRRLSRWGRRPAADDRGAVAATVAIMLGTGVLLGMAAVVVDVGRLYAEREQLQTGADAAAWSVAETCVLEPDSCAEQDVSAGQYASASANDGAAGISEICGRGPGLATCSPAATNRTACLGGAPATGAYAEVRTNTLRRDGSTLLPPTFARIFAGDDAGTAVAACSRIAWGPPRRTSGMALTFSTCEWSDLTDGGTTFWPAPSVSTPPQSAERVIYLKGNSLSTTCPAGPSGWDRPGGFGWLDDTRGDCTTIVRSDDSFSSDPGSSGSGACQQALRELHTDRRSTLIPIYDGVKGSGNNIVYHLGGFASFVITGYHLGGNVTAQSWLTNRNHCNNPNRCVYGYFTRGLVATTGVAIGGTDFGVSVVNLVG